MAGVSIIAVGSKNPAKIDAVRIGFMKGWLRVDTTLQSSSETLSQSSSSLLSLVGYDVDSKVSSQPIGDHETKQGALNRATAAYQEYITQHGHQPHFSVGLEGGITTREEGRIPYLLSSFIQLISILHSHIYFIHSSTK